MYKSFSREVGDARRRLLSKKAMFSQFCGPGDLVFDIGANVGNRTLAFCECGANVVAVDPQPECCDYIKRTLVGQKVIVVQAAVGDGNEAARLFRSGPLDSVASISEAFMRRVRATRRFNVEKRWSTDLVTPIIKVGQLEEKYGVPRFLHIDTAGSEWDVIKSIKSPPGALSFRWIPELFDDTQLSLERCQDLGFIYFHLSFMEGMRFCHLSSVTSSIIIDILSRMMSDTYLYADIYATAVPLHRLVC